MEHKGPALIVGGASSNTGEKAEKPEGITLRGFALLLAVALTVPVAWGKTSAPAGNNASVASACANCHEEARSQPATSMAHALEIPAECRVLSTHSLMAAQVGKYTYRIERRGNTSVYSVSDGVRTLAMPIAWALGASSGLGQTYVLEQGGKLYESRVSYFAAVDGLDLTLGAENSPPTYLREAAGRRMDLSAELDCFGCHATNAIADGRMTFDRMSPGVRCARCHGSPRKHLAAVNQGHPERAKMKDLSRLSSEQISNFCGQCHRTWDQVVLAGKLDINDIRFQPYRLTGSKCYDSDDARISCVACHEPHDEVDKKSADYDTKCEACHGGGKRGAKVCHVSSHDCATCHMPRYELPESHHKFCDHRIRIVKANEPFPG
jgi:Cytochrome c554 and c-prime